MTTLFTVWCLCLFFLVFVCLDVMLTGSVETLGMHLEYDEKKAIKCLREKMESGVAFTMDETIQAAVSAFQHLFLKKFKANETGRSCYLIHLGCRNKTRFDLTY